MCREMILTGGGALAVNGNVLSTVLAKSNYAMMMIIIIISFYKIMVLVCRLLNLMNPR
jgi:hypothetical protein